MQRVQKLRGTRGRSRKAELHEFLVRLFQKCDFVFFVVRVRYTYISAEECSITFDFDGERVLPELADNTQRE